MKKIILCLIFVVIISNTYAFDDDDFQVWFTTKQEKKIKEGLKVVLEEEFHWGDNTNEFYYHHYDLGLVHSINKNLDLGINYRQVYEKKKGKFKEENRPHLNATLKWKFKDFKFENRNRIEYRYFDYKSDCWRYRNRLKIKLPYKFTKLKIQPYVSDEIFIDFGTTNRFNRNRLSAGLDMSLTKNIKGEIYYTLQTTRKKGEWNDINVLGIGIKVIF